MIPFLPTYSSSCSQHVSADVYDKGNFIYKCTSCLIQIKKKVDSYNILHGWIKWAFFALSQAKYFPSSSSHECRSREEQNETRIPRVDSGYEILSYVCKASWKHHNLLGIASWWGFMLSLCDGDDCKTIWMQSRCVMGFMLRVHSCDTCFEASENIGHTGGQMLQFKQVYLF